MMTNEQIFFLRLLSDHLNDRKTELISNVNWDEIHTYAKDHQVRGIVYQQCKQMLPTVWKERFEKESGQEAFFYYNRVKLFEEVSNTLKRAGIPFYSVKGIEVSHFYPVPALRTMGDCDIIVHPEDKEKAHSVMLSLGFECHLKAKHEWIYYKNNMEFEIHDHLLYETINNLDESRFITDTAWEYVHLNKTNGKFELDWTFHYMYLLLHLKKHLFSSGIGFRQFMDLAVVMKNYELNWRWLEESLKKQGLLKFASVCLHLLYLWFEIDVPIEVAECNEEFYVEATKKIFANGIFGYNNEENNVNSLRNENKIHKEAIWVTCFRRLKKEIFLPYNNIRTIYEYAFVDSRPWLLPIAWIYRFYRSLRYKKANVKMVFDRNIVSKKKMDKRDWEMEQWGL